MTRAAVSSADLRRALGNLALVAAGFVRGRGRVQARAALLAAVTEANQYLGAVDAPAQIRDPEALVVAYIAAGGDWHALVGAVNRAALDGATRKVS